MPIVSKPWSVNHHIGFVHWVHTPELFFYDPTVPDLLHCDLSALDLTQELQLRVYHYRTNLYRAIDTMCMMGADAVRTNISWAERVLPNGRAIQLWYLTYMAERLVVLPNLNYIPPELSENPAANLCNIPPKNLEWYAEFVEDVAHDLLKLGITAVQHMNEMNLNTDWNPDYDLDGRKAARMVNLGSAVTKRLGLISVLSGMNKPDFAWLQRFCEHGGVEHIDVCGQNCLRATWSEHMLPMDWNELLPMIQECVRTYGGKSIPVIATEAGYPTVDFRTIPISEHGLQEIQVSSFAQQVQAVRNIDVPIYWYSLLDMHPQIKSVRAVTTGWEDLIQYYFGCFTFEWKPKLLGQLLQSGGVQGVMEYIQKNHIESLYQTIIHRIKDTDQLHAA